MIIQARGWENFVYVAHLLGESGVPGEPLGANAIAIADDAVFPDEVAAELAAVSDFAGSPPVADVQGVRQALLGDRDHQPLSPAALAPSTPGPSWRESPARPARSGTAPPDRPR